MYLTIDKGKCNDDTKIGFYSNDFYYMDFLPEAIIIQRNDRIIYFNIAFTNLIKLQDLNSPLGEKFYDFFEIDKENLQNINCNKLLHFEVKSMEIQDFHGNSIDIELKSSINKNTSLNEEIIIIIRDITMDRTMKKRLVEEEVLLQQTIEYDKLKTDFLSNISHELRTPLNILLSSLQVLNLYTNNINNKEIINVTNYLKIMKQNCYRLLRLVNNFIDITKIDAGFYQLNSKNRDIVNIVEEITLSVVQYTKNKNIDILFDTEVEEKIVSFDEDKLERIMLNLLSNAIKFTNPGGKVEVNIYDRDSNIIISIKDTGIGIPEDKLEIIFDRFSQVDNLLTRKKEGSGIGLSLVKNLVEMHGGKIEVKSTYGQGTEFLIYLPANQGDHFYQIEMDLSKECEMRITSNIETMNIEFSDIYLV